jgi:hypothetical protein
MLARSHFHFGVMIGCSEQRMSRCNGQRRYWHDCRIQRFQHGTSSHAHINPQAVAASRFDPAYRRHEIFWARDFQHRRRVALPRHAHGRTSIAALTSTFCHNATKRQARKLRRSHAVSFVALSQNETRIRALRLRANEGQRSSFSRSSVSTVRGPAGWSGQRLISRSLISPARISDTHRANLLADANPTRIRQHFPHIVGGTT